MVAIRMALRHRPAVVLMDVRLGSGMDGVEAVRKILEVVRCTLGPLDGNVTSLYARQRA
jgi:two-component system, response regulator PdtaR